MKRQTEELKKTLFDILVIGGGINGCAIARDASLRGAKAALIEKDDFASGASGKTTKLIHGGIRYLEQFNFKLVYEALQERAILLRTIPHLVKPLDFIIPVYKGDPRSLLKMRSGVFLYDLMAGRKNIHCHRSLQRRELISLEKNIGPDGLKGGVQYCDAQMDDVRICLDNAISASEAGCCAANKVEAVAFIKEEGKVAAIEALDNLTQEKFSIRASIVINTTGAWSNKIVSLDEPNAPPITRPTKGIHIVYRRLPHKHAILVSAHKDKRVLFVIPWRALTLIGTTDTDYRGSNDEVYANLDEVEYLLSHVRRLFPSENIDKKGIIPTYASLRPLVNTQGRPSWQVSREHLIKESPSGLISVVGGKYTTYRHLAEEVTDLALLKLKGRDFKKCITDTTGPSSQASSRGKMALPELIEHSVKNEMANSLNGLLIRRLQLSSTPSRGLEYLNDCANIMGGILGWSEAQRESEIDRYKKEISRNMNF